MTPKATIVLLFVTLVLLPACSITGESRSTAAEYSFNGTAVPAGAIELEDFILQSAEGPVQLSDFGGQYVVVYFGYTFCPDFCPITLSQLKDVRAGLGDRANEMQVVMITVDPERDTPEKLAEYVTVFDPSFVGLTGTEKQIETAAAPFGVFYEIGQVAEQEEYYLVNHTTRIFLVGPEGNALLTWGHETTTEAIMADLNHLMGIVPTES